MDPATIAVELNSPRVWTIPEELAEEEDSEAGVRLGVVTLLVCN